MVVHFLIAIVSYAVILEFPIKLERELRRDLFFSHMFERCADSR